MKNNPFAQSDTTTTAVPQQQGSIAALPVNPHWDALKGQPLSPTYLVLHLTNGNIDAFNYSYMSRIEYLAREGKIALTHTRAIIYIAGDNLEELLYHIIERCVSYIYESPRPNHPRTVDTTITSIEIKNR